MARVLTVDDSRAIRAMITKEVRALQIEVDEAEDGEQALSRVEECSYDLILLDVTMPVLDGPGMLAKLRASGNKTPVVMLTSESKKGVVSTVMKLGIDDYILKPFKPDELAAKVKKVLKLAEGGGSAAAVMAPPSAQPAAAPMPAAAVGADGGPTAGRQFIDLLVIDDMDNVPRKLRTMIPQHLSLSNASSGFAAIAVCRERVFRVVLIDYDIPDVNCAALVNQLRSLQPHAAFLSMALKTSKSAEDDARKQGFDGVLFKPFDVGAVEDFLLQYFDNQDLVTIESNVLKLSKFSGRDDCLDRYFQRAGKLCEESISKLAAACFEEAIIDLSLVPARMDRIPTMVVAMSKTTKEMGLELRLVGTPEIKAILANFADTNSVPFYTALEDARKVA